MVEACDAQRRDQGVGQPRSAQMAAAPARHPATTYAGFLQDLQEQK